MKLIFKDNMMRVIERLISFTPERFEFGQVYSLNSYSLHHFA